MKTLYYILITTFFCFGSLSAQHNYDDQSVIYSNNGKVGIGTSTPYTHSKLDIQSNYSVNKFASQLHLHTANNPYGMFLGSYNASLGYISVGGHYNSAGNHLARSEYSTGIYQYQGKIHFYSNSNLTPHTTFQPIYRMTINDNGNVGIGTINTFGYKLAVNGIIGAKEVNVEISSPWPDYVFSNNYVLPTLDEVETHIKENGHLKDIPRETEVKANGINLGEMDAKLLQKIEELTLYTIEQQKLIEAVCQELSIIKQENKNLHKEIENIKNK